ncbi:aspartyl-phosphate phosphatase Spo0E family protein [Cohnella sp.]|uniref:aspartyl-phosphate phosphatase Spo0E family protein n=1 Tax=Cohnella sp. TaxID=1883426 RepID=UPI003561CD30
MKMENLRDQLYQLALLHRYNLLHPDVIRKSQELDLLINEMTYVKPKGPRDEIE